MRITASACLLLLLPGIAAAEERRDIDWYVNHSAARASILRLCRSDHRYDFSPDCANAESAETKLWARRTAADGAAPGRILNSPEYWASNPFSRVAALEQCRLPTLGTMTPSQCAAARQGEAMARGHR
jgi:hypothetical protein